MKRFFLPILISIFIFSCQPEYQPRDIDSITIKEFTIDSVSIRTIQAISDQLVFYADSKGAIGYTVDGGNTWFKNSLSYQDSIIPNFRSMSSNGDDIFTLTIGNPALLFKFDKHGSNSYNASLGKKSELTVFSSEIVYKEEHEKVFYDSMKFFDAQNGIAMGDPTEDCLSMIVTRDGGNTWNKIPCDRLPEVIDGEAAFASSNTNIKTLGETAWVVTGGAKARVFKTTDLGETWKVFDTPIIQGDGPQGIYSVDFADKMNGIIVGGDYSKPEGNRANKAITTDGGETWTLVANGENPNYKSCVQYVPNTDGKEVFAVGKTGISYSKDGGITWKEVSKEGYYAIEFVDRNNAWLSGNQKMGKLKLR